MSKLNHGIIRHKRTVVIVFLSVAVVCAFMILGVKVNYNMTDYLPPSAQSTKAVEIMGEEFTQAVPNASVMVRDVSIPEALAYKDELAALPGVSEVLWLDDMIDIKTPLQVADQDTVEGFYKDGDALFSVTVEKGMETEATLAMRELAGENGAVAGEAPDQEAMRSATGSEVGTAVAILLPAILAILFISTASWLEPLLFLAAIGVSIVINMGTNLFLGEVSFVTNSVSPILQLAVSLDYAIFLLHSFADYRKQTDDVHEAMALAMRKSMPAVAASALTTMFGFLALAFMEFQIGADLGLNLVKGIILSFVSCMVFLPALTLLCYKAIDKTTHRDILPSFSNIGRLVAKVCIPVTIVVVLLVVPSFLGQSHTSFNYGSQDANQSGRSAQDAQEIQQQFGQATIMALLVPRGDVVKEYELGVEVQGLDHVTGVMSYANTVGTGIPADFLDDEVTKQFYSDNYARIIVYTDTPSEGDVAFATVEAIDETTQKFYGDEYYSAGQSANLYDMKNIVEVDNNRVNLIAIVAIFAVLFFTFRSASLPFILLFTIEAGIWINLAIPYFMGEPINFLGYLVVNTVQLGATVDYAILLTSYYMDNRKRMPQREAIRTSLGETFKSILVSASTLTLAGFTLSATSSNPAVSIIGLLLGRGTILSFVMVVFMLPLLLTVFDRMVGATTLRSGFYRKRPLPADTFTKRENGYEDEVG